MLGEAAVYDVEFVFAPAAEAGVVAGLPRATRSLPRKRLIAGGTALLLVALAAGFFLFSGGPTVEAQVYRYAFTKGDNRNYDFSMEIDVTPSGVPGAEPFKGKMSGTMGLIVTNQYEDGSAVLDLTMSGLSFEPDGPAGVTPGTLTLTVAPDGRVTNVVGSGGLIGAAGSAMQGAMSTSGSPSDSQFLFPRFPADELEKGDEWTETSQIPAPFGGSPIPMTVKGTLDGFAGTDFGDAAKIHHIVTVPLNVSAPVPEGAGGTMKITGDMTMDMISLVLPTNGDLVSMTGKVVMKMQMALEGISGAGPLSFDATMDLKMERV